MDIVTHAMMGVVVASPALETHPVAAGLFMFGSALPDLDALSRVFGKRAFLHSHQTYSHALPVIAVVAGLVGLALWPTGFWDPWAPAALAAGMVFHSFLDVTNTYGIMIFAPFTKKRFCLEWVFFIDAFVAAATIPCTLYVGYYIALAEAPPPAIPYAYAATMATYWLVKVAMRQRAGRLAPKGTLALLPSALIPWEYLGCVSAANADDGVRTFRIHALTGRLSHDETVPIFDAQWRAVLDALPEYQTMRALSPAYHVASVETNGELTTLTVRDFRTRNFKTRFGELEVQVDANREIASWELHV